MTCMQDCDIASATQLVAAGLVSGQVQVFRYQQDDSEPGTSTSTRTSVQQVLCRNSKRPATSCRALHFAPDGASLLCGFETGSILHLDAASGKLRRRLGAAHEAPVSRVLPLDAQLVAAGDEGGGLRVWDLRRKASVQSYSKHTDYITDLAVSDGGSGREGRYLLATSGDGTLSVHDMRACKAVARSEDDADDELLSGAGGVCSDCPCVCSGWDTEPCDA